MQLRELNSRFSTSVQSSSTTDREAATRELPPPLLRDAAKCKDINIIDLFPLHTNHKIIKCRYSIT